MRKASSDAGNLTMIDKRPVRGATPSARQANHKPKPKVTNQKRVSIFDFLSPAEKEVEKEHIDGNEPI